MKKNEYGDINTDMQSSRNALYLTMFIPVLACYGTTGLALHQKGRNDYLFGARAAPSRTIPTPPTGILMRNTG